ncbi:MAG: hypothetical protein J6Y13_02055 [Treponema sp.]|nr:hypothetical protein [Treponema sp.]
MSDMNNTPIEVESGKLQESLPRLYESGVTEFYIHDRALASDKKALLSLLDLVAEKCPDMFLSLPVDVRLIDMPLLDKLSDLFVSIEIPFEGTLKGGVLSFDRKLYKGKAALLNNSGLVFGFSMGWGIQQGDTFRAFRDRLDFAVSLYPNHIDFPQFEKGNDRNGSPDGNNGNTRDSARGNKQDSSQDNARSPEAKPTGIYSSKDLDFSRSMAFACRTFYTAGRAVPWFNQITAALKISPSTLFADADEWQQCNNCSYYTEFIPEDAEHKELERMQLAFFKEKFEEKHKGHLWAAAEDLIRLNGAFSRVVEENEESTLELTYSPDDLLSPEASDLVRFCDCVTEEPCTVKIYENHGNPDYRII